MRSIATGLAAFSVVLAGCGGGSGPVSQPLPDVSAAAPSTAGPSASATPSATPRPVTSTAPAPTRPPTARPPSRPPTPGLPPALAGHVVNRLPTTARVVALTFDGGSANQGLTSILGTLARQHVRATFFFTGAFARRYPDQVRAVTAAGHLVGNHTLTHPHLNSLSNSAVSAEVTGAASILAPLLGHSPRPWFRFPFGEYDARTLGVVNGLGYGAIGWTVDSRGWLGSSDGDAQDVVRRVVAAEQPGEIVLMHVGANPDDGTTYDADALAQVITRLRADGYTFVTVARALT